MVSKRTLEWRDTQKDYIEKWRIKIKELHQLSFLERWNQDKFEMEVLRFIENQKMKAVFIFAKNFIDRYKEGKFQKEMTRIYKEIIDYGVIEPSRLHYFFNLIENMRRKQK
ncbi:MAG: hypothetical protein A3A72_05555 [Deltaproteobacteria bacterium RIFCSPLOWO2_01_FULL_38_9]|nr:MAG: hypothetical protein A3A72_05555 [Deltaproteobacteria bacterium RIFCSPLOWO2_01_FULL_38_9]